MVGSIISYIQSKCVRYVCPSNQEAPYIHTCIHTYITYSLALACAPYSSTARSNTIHSRLLPAAIKIEQKHP